MFLVAERASADLRKVDDNDSTGGDTIEFWWKVCGGACKGFWRLFDGVFEENNKRSKREKVNGNSGV